MRLKNKTCVVTGAAAGIGFATASAFAVEGAHVIALDRDLNGLQALKAECPTVKTHILDVTDADAVTLFFETSNTLIKPVMLMFHALTCIFSPVAERIAAK